MAEVLNFHGEYFLISAIHRREQEPLTRMFGLARELVEICATVADSGGDRQQMIAKVANYVEPLPSTQKKFAARITDGCALIASRYVQTGGDAPGSELRRQFAFVDAMEETGWEFHDWFASLHPSACEVSIDGFPQLTKEQRIDAVDRVMDSLESTFGSHRAVVDAYEAAYEGEPGSPEVEAWNKATAVATKMGLNGVPTDPNGSVKFFTHYTS